MIHPKMLLIGLAASQAALSAAMAAAPADAYGLWRSADDAAVIRFQECPDAAGSLCGVIVWDKDAGTPQDACGATIARLKAFAGEAWRDGWTRDPRNGKTYRAIVRTDGDTLLLRGYIGTEVLGETERMSRTGALPEGCPR
ncbi:DUF2147 domain-containing protein [Castellaniella defragrans]|uniref:Uncharacterized protein (DUF2147 family) n=1 Tax=Castellaniella defragrans TaxID=75697 RepID=A0A7W9WPL6_CASDE|nr:DUF2147 domain-containing protein [Castellaniella defragrans]MBB6084723.1 uncharacterized protein (DUF2147 family) [Castellaniella defragrans]